jgi:hypothetical protein
LEWTDRGTVLLGFDVDADSGNTYAVCGTVHLTDFSAKQKVSFFHTNKIDIGSDAGLLLSAFNPANLLPTLVVLGLVVVFVGSWVVSVKVSGCTVGGCACVSGRATGLHTCRRR